MLHPAAVDKMTTAIRKFNAATWPSDLGLGSSFPFRIWRGEQLAALKAPEVVPTGVHGRHCDLRAFWTSVPLPSGRIQWW